MSKEKVPKSKDTSRIRELLKLDATIVGDYSFCEYLSLLKNSDVSEPAAGTLMRAILQSGEVDIEKEPKERRPYLKLMRRLGYPTYQAYNAVRGSQRPVGKLMDYVRGARQGGYQDRSILIFLGPPASGKGELSTCTRNVVEGMVVYANKDCPVNEPPINLLKLLPKETVNALSQELGMIDEDGRDRLQELVDAAGKPCHACWSAVADKGGKKDIGFGNLGDPSPNLDSIRVQAVRITARKFGIATWATNSQGQSVSLPHVIAKANRGVCIMPEMFGTGNALRQMETLVDVKNDKQTPADSISNQLSGFLPLDLVLIGETNKGAWENFLESQPDPAKFTSRFTLLEVPYITSVTEEELVYKDSIAEMKARPHLDPLAFKMVALLSVISRLNRSSNDIDVISKARMYDGEELLIEKPVKSADPYNTSKKLVAPDHGGTYWTVPELWQRSPDEGSEGLSMRRMLTFVSNAIDYALNHPGKEQCLSTVGENGVLSLLRKKLQELESTSGIDYEERKIIRQALQDLRPAVYGSSSSPGLIEGEYQRILYRQVMEACAPDYDVRANELYEKYRLSCNALVSPSGRVFDERSKRNVEADIPFMEELERFMGFSNQDETGAFRRSIEVKISRAIKEHKQKHGAGCADFEVDWETIPLLAKAIKSKLVDEVSKLISRLVQSDLELSEKDQVLKKEALDRLQASGSGYCPHCLKETLTYFEAFELWDMTNE